MSFLNRKVFLLAFFFLFSSIIFSPTLMAQEDKTKPIKILGDTVEYFQEEQKTVGTGHVKIDYQGAVLEADKITVFMTTRRAVAEGHVTLTQKGSVFKGEHAEYDFEKKVGYVSQMNATIPLATPPTQTPSLPPGTSPEYYAKMGRIEKVSDNHFKAVDTSITTCCGDSPFYKIGAKEIDIFPDDKIVIRNALMYIKGVPVLFIPYFVQPMVDFDRLPVQLIPGRSREWGTFLLSKWRYNLVNREDLSVKGAILADYREKRGFGGGAETFYRGDKIGHGAIRGYYAQDDEAPIDAEEDRYRGQWRHQSKIGADTTLTTEITTLSDPTIVKDFFYREEYEKNVAPENYVSIITAKPEYTFSVLERHRINDFFTTVNRSPELRFDTHNRAFADTPFYLRQEVQFTNLQKEFAGVSDELDATRLDLNHTLLYAASLGNVSITPRIGARETFYSRDLAGDEDHVRSAIDPGIDVSTRFYKTYDVSIHRWGLDYNQVRHVFKPTLSYNYRPTPTIARTRLQAFDELDALDKQNFVRFHFENNFHTKEKAADGSLSPREFARIDPFMDYNVLVDRIDNVGIRSELRPYSWLGMNTETSLNTRTGKVETSNFDIYLNRGPWKASLGQRYVLDESSQTTADLALKVNDWEFRVYDRFEFQTGSSEEFEVTVSKYWSCIITDFTYNHREGDTFYFAIRLIAYPTTPFGFRQSYNHPRASGREI